MQELESLRQSVVKEALELQYTRVQTAQRTFQTIADILKPSDADYTRAKQDYDKALRFQDRLERLMIPRSDRAHYTQKHNVPAPALSHRSPPRKSPAIGVTKPASTRNNINRRNRSTNRKKVAVPRRQRR